MNPRVHPYNEDPPSPKNVSSNTAVSSFTAAADNHWSGFCGYWLVLPIIENLFGNIHYELLCVRLLLLTIRVVKLIYHVKCISGSIAERYFIISLFYISLSFQPVMDIWVLSLAVLNKAATFIHKSVWIYIFTTWVTIKEW